MSGLLRVERKYEERSGKFFGLRHPSASQGQGKPPFPHILVWFLPQTSYKREGRAGADIQANEKAENMSMGGGVKIRCSQKGHAKSARDFHDEFYDPFRHSKQGRIACQYAGLGSMVSLVPLVGNYWRRQSLPLYPHSAPRTEDAIEFAIYHFNTVPSLPNEGNEFSQYFNFSFVGTAEFGFEIRKKQIPVYR